MRSMQEAMETSLRAEHFINTGTEANWFSGHSMRHILVKMGLSQCDYPFNTENASLYRKQVHSLARMVMRETNIELVL